MSLPTASQNTQYYLQAGYGLACAVASAEMTHFVGALSLRFDPFGGASFAVRSVGGIISASLSFWRCVFCGSVHWGRRLCGSILYEACLCGSILLEARLLRFGLLGALSLRFDPFGGVSFAVRSVGGVVSTVRSFRRCCTEHWQTERIKTRRQRSRQKTKES
jgi:hypothetical protein